MRFYWQNAFYTLQTFNLLADHVKLVYIVTEAVFNYATSDLLLSTRFTLPYNCAQHVVYIPIWHAFDQMHRLMVDLIFTFCKRKSSLQILWHRTSVIYLCIYDDIESSHCAEWGALNCFLTHKDRKKQIKSKWESLQLYVSAWNAYFCSLLFGFKLKIGVPNGIW